MICVNLDKKLRRGKVAKYNTISAASIRHLVEMKIEKRHLPLLIQPLFNPYLHGSIGFC